MPIRNPLGRKGAKKPLFTSGSPLKTPKLRRRTQKRLLRLGLVFGNVALFIIIGSFILLNRSANPTIKRSTVNSAVQTASGSLNPLDQLSSAEIAAQAAQLVNMPELVSVVNQADSEVAMLSFVPNDSTVLTKPQIVNTGQKSKKDIFRYKVKAGETVSSIAGRYGLSAESIRWSNSLSGDRLEEGRELIIPPGNGLVYKVKVGDSVDSIVGRYGGNRSLFVAVNDAESGILKTDDLVWVPDGRVFSVSSGYSNSGSFFSFARFGSNGYSPGYCTWHAANRRAEIGRPIPSNLGNAITWSIQARAFGFAVDGNPAAGDVLYHRNIGGLGHVGFVEKKNPDGSLTVSDMNYPSWGRVTYRTVTPAEFGNYYFIH